MQILLGDGERPDGVPGWLGEGANDLRNLPVGAQRFADVDTDIIDPATNDRKAVLALRSNDQAYLTSQTIPLNTTCGGIYIHHCMAGGGLAGTFEVEYTDGQVETVYVQTNNQAMSWFMPPHEWNNGPGKERRRDLATSFLAWNGANPVFDSVGTCMWGGRTRGPMPKYPLCVSRKANRPARGVFSVSHSAIRNPPSQPTTPVSASPIAGAAAPSFTELSKAWLAFRIKAAA